MGERLATVGLMVAVIDAEGTLLGGNAPFLERALGKGQKVGSTLFRDLISASDGPNWQRGRARK